MMISLEVARELKEAGLEWEPKIGDFVYDECADRPGVIGYLKDATDFKIFYLDKTGWAFTFTEQSICLPRLDQLLGEIVKRGYVWEAKTVIDESGVIPQVIEYWIYVYKLRTWPYGRDKTFNAKTPDDAAARALLWIMRGE